MSMCVILWTQARLVCCHSVSKGRWDIYALGLYRGRVLRESYSQIGWWVPIWGLGTYLSNWKCISVSLISSVQWQNVCDIHNAIGWFFYFCEHPSSYEVIFISRAKQLNSKSYYIMGGTIQFKKLKQLEMGNAGSEMKRESTFGTGQWLGIQWTEAIFVWTALFNKKEKLILKHYLCLWYKAMVLFWWCSVFKQALPSL